MDYTNPSAPPTIMPGSTGITPAFPSDFNKLKQDALKTKLGILYEKCRAEGTDYVALYDKFIKSNKYVKVSGSPLAFWEKILADKTKFIKSEDPDPNIWQDDRLYFRAWRDPVTGKVNTYCNRYFEALLLELNRDI